MTVGAAVLALTGGMVTAVASPIGSDRPGLTEQVDLTSAAAQAKFPAAGDCGVNVTSVSADGRYVAFDSVADNLVPDDENHATDVFVRDRRTGKTRLVSGGLNGLPAVGVPVDGCHLSFSPAISANGRYVAFLSVATNLVMGDTNAIADVFVHDMKAQVTLRVSVKSGGAQAGTPALDTVMSTGNLAISADGRYVTFTSWLSDLVPSDKNSSSDVFWHDRVSGVTKMASVTSRGIQADAGVTNPFLIGSAGSSVSAHGRYVAFMSHAPLTSDDTNQEPDVFVRDMTAGRTSRVSVASDGSQGISSTSMFGGAWTNTQSFPNQIISDDGRYVAFWSYQDNLVPNDSNVAQDLFVHDRKTGRTERVSVNSSGEPTPVDPHTPSISGDGRFVAFTSASPGFAPDDRGSDTDVFVYDLRVGSVELVSRNSHGHKGSGGCTDGDTGAVLPYLSTTGRYVGYTSCFSNLISRQNPDYSWHAYLRDRGSPLGADMFGGTARPGKAKVDALGADLVGARAAYRRGSRDLFVRLDLASMPAVIGTPAGGPMYGLDLTADHARYQVRVQRVPGPDYDAAGGASFGLYRQNANTGRYVKVATLKGGYGTTGDAVVFALPLADLGLASSKRIGHVTAFTGQGSYATGVVHSLDTVRLVAGQR